MVNIHEIAKKSGYSVSTVSRVLNNKKYVSESTKQKIKSIMKEMDYVPNSNARNLSHGNTNNIGVVLPHTKHPYFTELLNGIISQSFSTKYNIIILPSGYNENIELQYLEELKRKYLDAIIFTSRAISLGTLNRYTSYGNIVYCGNAKIKGLLEVYTKREEAYIELFTWIKKKKKKRILFLLSRPYELSNTSKILIDTYQKIFNTKIKPSQIITDINNYDDGIIAAKSIVETKKTIDCIVANSDDIAAAFIQIFKEKKKKIPLIIGQENQLSGQLLNISTIDHHFKIIGKLAFDLAIGENHSTSIELKSTFINRLNNI